MATKTLFTLEEFDALPDDGLRHELNKGELVTMTFPAWGHNRVIRRIYDIISEFLRSRPLGEVVWTDSGFLLSNPGEPVTLRGPDLAFLPRDRSAQITNSARRAQGAPELAIEVVSPSDRPAELLEKVGQYLNAGGLLVWVVYPEEREVRVFEASGAMCILKGNDRIDAPSLLPGFSAPVSAFFESPL